MELWPKKSTIRPTFDEYAVNCNPSSLWIHWLSVHSHDIETESVKARGILKNLDKKLNKFQF